MAPELIFYDGHCGLCHGFVKFALARDREGARFRFAPLPEQTLRFFGLAGTPADCAASLRELLERFPQIAQVTIVPAAPARGTVAEVVHRFMREVVPLAAREGVPA